MEAPVDRRTEFRMQAMRPGMFIDARGKEIDCTVRDVSISGASVELPQSVELVEPIQLCFKGDKKPFECRVMWRTEDGVGVEFLNRNW